MAGRSCVTLNQETALPLHFVGLWDTVSAMGLPWQDAIFRAERTALHQRTPPLNVLAARHALALHELRADFKPELWGGGGHCNLMQVWFSGAHADVGGGYALDESGLSNIALRWMADGAKNFKLQLNPEVLKQFTTAVAEVRHNAIRGLFRGATPTLREALEHMNTQRAVPNPEGVGPLHFHRSVLRHLEEHAVQVGSSWPNRVRAEMGKIDDLAVRAYVVNQLLGTLSVGNASRTALTPSKYA